MAKLLSEILENTSSDDLDTLLSHVSELSFNALPDSLKDSDSYYYFTIKVVYRGKGKWGVVDRLGALDHNCISSYEPQPSSRTKKYLKNHRFSLIEAVRIAEQAQHEVKCFNKTASEWAEYEEAME